jgi:stage V sporulation protein SpoVS
MCGLPPPTQEAKEIAGRLIDGCRAGDAPALLTIGAASVNQAVKAIAIARAELLKEGVSLTFQPAFRHTDRTKPLIAFYVAMQRTGRAGGDAGDDASDVALTATAQGKVVPLAGAIAGKVRVFAAPAGGRPARAGRWLAGHSRPLLPGPVLRQAARAPCITLAGHLMPLVCCCPFALLWVVCGAGA